MDNKSADLTKEQLLRRKAEEYLKKTKDNTMGQAIESDVMKLLHELQVHQIELEMQNEELSQANASTEEALKKYTMLYDFAPMGYFTIDKSGTISELNFTGADILGEKRFSLINSNIKLFISEDSKSTFIDFIDRVYASQSKESCEVKIGHNGKASCHVYMEGVLIADDKLCLLSVVDISNFKK
jgi:PAS domain-containing protein